MIRWLALAALLAAPVYAVEEHCRTVADSPECESYREPLIISEGVQAEVKGGPDREVKIELQDITEDDRDWAIACDTAQCACSGGECTCEGSCSCSEGVYHLAFSGEARGLPGINAAEQQAAAGMQCSVADAFVTRQPMFAYASPVFVSKLIYNVNYCRGCGGSCHGNVTMATYDAQTGREVKLADAVAEKDLPALRKVLEQAFVERHVKKEGTSGEQEKHITHVKKSLPEHVRKNTEPGSPVYVEKGRLFVNIGGYVLSCSDGPFHPLEIPVAFLHEDFRQLLQRKVN